MNSKMPSKCPKMASKEPFLSQKCKGTAWFLKNAIFSHGGRGGGRGGHGDCTPEDLLNVLKYLAQQLNLSSAISMDKTN